jgi:integrase
MAEGIVVRHSRSCAVKRGAKKCSCDPSYLPRVWDSATRGYVNGPTSKNIAEAKTWRIDALKARERKLLRPATRANLDEAADEWLEGARAGRIRDRSGDTFKPSTVRGYEGSLRRYVLPGLGGARLSDVTRNHLQDLADELLGEGFDPSTVRNAIMPLRAIYRRAVKRGEVAVNPTHDLDLPAVRGRRDRFATPEEAASLIDALTVQDRPFWATAFYAGLRRGELRALDWGDVDTAAGVIHVRDGWDPKEGRIAPKSHKGARRVPLIGGVRDVLVEHRMTTWSEGFVFGRAPDLVMAPTTFQERADKAWAVAGLARITPHECRHTFASLMIEAGVNAKALSEFLGHSSIQVTYDTYGHLMPGSEAEAACRLEALLDGAEERSRAAAVDRGTQDGTQREFPVEIPHPPAVSAQLPT